jgi:carbamoyltransferase
VRDRDTLRFHPSQEVARAAVSNSLLKDINKKQMIVLGINGVDEIFHDASASLVVDGRIIASVEEERFNRKKHTNGIPFQAIEYCLKKAGIGAADVDYIGYYLEPEVLRKAFFTDIVEQFQCDPSRIDYILRTADNIHCIERRLREKLFFGPKTKFQFLNHHVAHAASAYYVSGFHRAAILTIDGSGDRESSVLFRGDGSKIEQIHDFLVYPESLGFIYTVFAAHLGLGWISGPGKLMGLAGYGRPDCSRFEDIIRLKEDPRRPIEIDLSFFQYHLGGPGMSAKGIARFGEPLQEGGELTQLHCNLAATVQKALERAILHIVSKLQYFLPEEKNLCLSGGVALNVTTNRRIKDLSGFDHLFITPPAYDGGTSLGCALYLSAKLSGEHDKSPFDVYLGPDIEDYDVEAALRSFGSRIEWQRLPKPQLIERAAQALAEKRFIGWVQGRMECGPRALGNRSILANPILADTKYRLNAGIKKREAFRPYAPSVLQEECAHWFDLEDSPYMLLEATVQRDKRHKIPAVVHIDGSSRPQTVTEHSNPLFYGVIKEFYQRTGVPLVLNTSFNQHGEPLVNRPEEAVAMLLATDLDELFLGDYHVRPNHAVDHSDPERAVHVNAWTKPFEILRARWGTVPMDVNSSRRSSSELLQLSDTELARVWTEVRDADIHGSGFQVRGWFHEVYKEFMAGKKVLDMGCGFGISSISFAQMGARVTFADIIEDNVKLVEKVCRGLGISDRVAFQYVHELDDLASLPRDFDVITALGSLHNAPFEFMQCEVAELVRHLRIGGRWLQLAYPEARWIREGGVPFSEWGKHTDGEGTPYCEWYDLPKLLRLMAPASFEPVFYLEWHNKDFNWFDLKLLSYEGGIGPDEEDSMWNTASSLSDKPSSVQQTLAQNEGPLAEMKRKLDAQSGYILELENERARLDAIENSRGWKMLNLCYRFRNQIVPDGSRRRRLYDALRGKKEKTT